MTATGRLRSSAEPYALRGPAQLARFSDGLDMVEPGLVSVPRWRPEPNTFGVPDELDRFGGVGRTVQCGRRIAVFQP